MKYTITLGWIAHLALCRFRKKAKNFIMRPDNLIRTGKLLLLVIAIFPPKTSVTLAAEGNGTFAISGIILQALRLILQFAVHWPWMNG
jgi:hypothetical protein